MYQICRKPLVHSHFLGLGFLEWILRHYSSGNSKRTGTQREKQLPGKAGVRFRPIFHFDPDCCSEIDRKGCGWRGGDGDTLSSISRSVLSADKDNKPIFRWFIWSVWKSGRGLSGTWTSRNCIFGWRDFSRVLSGHLQESHLDGTEFLLYSSTFGSIKERCSGGT